jgi:large subunit ribosomal protein L22e
MPSLLKKPTAGKGKKKALSFVVDCSKPVDDAIMDIGAFETFLTERIKVNGKAGAYTSLHSSHRHFCDHE